MPIYYGTQEILNLYQGTTAIPEVYAGTDKVFGSAPVSRAFVRDYSWTNHSSSTLGVSAEIVNRPTNYAQGDLILLWTVADTGGSTDTDMNQPSGFTRVNRILAASGRTLAMLSYKVATASEPSSYTYAAYTTGSDGVSLIATIGGFTGSTANLRGAVAGNTNPISPAVTPATTKNLLIRGIAQDDNNGSKTWTWAPDASHTLIQQATNSSGGWSSAAEAQRDYDSTTATGTMTWTRTSAAASGGYAGFTIAIPSA